MGRFDPGAEVLSNGQVPFTGNQSMGSNRLTNLADPVDAQDAATRAFVLATAVGGSKFKGYRDCSGNPNYPAAVQGDFYVVSVAGKIGGASGVAVEVGDSYGATADNAGGTQAAVGSSWNIAQGNTQVDTDASHIAPLGTQAAGAIGKLADSGHVHAHGNIATGAQYHANVVAAAATGGFMSGADKTKLDAVGASANHADNFFASAAQGATADAALARAGGTMSGDINMGTQNITNAGRFTGDVTGNVTGNASGSSGSCTGNAATATTAPSGVNTGDQTITLTGDVTGSGTGSFAATIAKSTVGPLKAGVGTLSRLVKDTGLNSSQTLTAAHVLDGFINNAANTGPYTYTLPTVADLYAGLGSPTLGGTVLTGILFVRGGSTSTITMAANTGWTTAGTTLTIATLKVRIYMWSLTDSSNAVFSSIGVMDA